MKMQNKASVTKPSVQQLYNGQPQELPGSYEGTVKESFDRNTWVYRCVMAIAQSASTIPLVLYQKTNKELQEIEKHPLLDLLNKPNEQESGSDFFEKVIAFLMLSGNFYIEMVGPGKKSAPIELWAWRPDRTKIVPGNGKDFIKAYRYTVSGQDSDVEALRMVHGKFFSPLDDFYGMSPVQVAGNNIALNNKTTDWNRNLVENFASPSGFLMTEQKLSEPIFKRIKASIRSMFGGSKNAGKPHLLEAGTTWQQTGLSPKDMDFIESHKLTREEICAVFGVPPQMVGIQDKSTYANYEQARASFYTETVMPTLDKVVDALNHKLAPLFGDALVIGYDKDKINALQEDTDAKFKRMAEVKDMLTINERREALGYEALPYGDVILIPTTMYAVGNNADQYAPPVLSTDPQDEPKETTDEKINRLLGELEKKSKDDELIQAKRAIEDEMIAKYTPLVVELFDKERDALVKAFEIFGEEALLIALEEQEKQWNDLFTTLYEDVIKAIGPVEYDKLKDDIGKQHGGLEQKLISKLFKFAVSNIKKFITNTAAQEVRHVTDTTKKAVKKVLRQQVNEELSVYETAKRIRTVHEDFTPSRAAVIARTEVLTASSFAANEGAQQVIDDYGVEMEKEWSAAKDERTRETHIEANAQRVPFDKPYTVGGEDAMYPRDPNLSAAERIQCRCASKHIVK